MGDFVGSTVIRAPRERVFDYRLDLRNLPAYNPDVLGVRALANQPPGPGASYEFRVRIQPGLRISGTLTIVEVERPLRLTLAVQSIMNAREICTFETVAEGTRVEFRTIVDTPGGPLRWLVDKLFVLPNTRRQVLRELALMKEKLEIS
jgi:uncharacterized protein YndB with AHSA1/START domain